MGVYLATGEKLGHGMPVFKRSFTNSEKKSSRRAADKAGDSLAYLCSVLTETRLKDADQRRRSSVLGSARFPKDGWLFREELCRLNNVHEGHGRSE